MKYIFLFIKLFCVLYLYSQIPQGYYDEAIGLTGNELRNKLHEIISRNVVTVSYSSLLVHYQTTDIKPNGKVWDMYSDVPGGIPPYEYDFSNVCGNYNSEADCWNREHTVPASWFNNASPVYSDLFQVVPTDGYVNNKRANYPYGKVGTTTWVSLNGSKLGYSNYPGYSGIVFEPIDSFKGDFARIYFYMATRYKDKIPTWTTDVFSGDDLASWAKNLFLEWHHLDPVSYKEIKRNNDVYNIQKNRNPYIDNPAWVDLIWGTGSKVVNNENYFNCEILYNSTENFLLIKTSKNNGNNRLQILIFDILGKIIKSIEPEEYNDSNNIIRLNTSDLEVGMYIVQVICDKSFWYNKFFKK